MFFYLFNNTPGRRAEHKTITKVEKSTHIKKSSALLQISEIESAESERIIDTGKASFKKEALGEFAVYSFKNQAVIVVEGRPNYRAIFKSISREKVGRGT